MAFSISPKLKRGNLSWRISILTCMKFWNRFLKCSLIKPIKRDWNFRATFNPWFRGKFVVILHDCDKY